MFFFLCTLIFSVLGMFQVNWYFPIKNKKKQNQKTPNLKFIFSILIVHFTSFADKSCYYFMMGLADNEFTCKGFYANLWFLLMLIDAFMFLLMTTRTIRFSRFFDISFQFKIIMLPHMVHWVAAIFQAHLTLTC